MQNLLYMILMCMEMIITAVVRVREVSVAGVLLVLLAVMTKDVTQGYKYVLVDPIWLPTVCTLIMKVKELM